MGFSSSEVNKITFKALAAKVIDSISTSQWYESRFLNNPVVPAERVLMELGTVQQYPASTLSQAQTNVSTYLSGIVDDLTNPASAIRMTQAVSGNNLTWAAYVTYNDPSSGMVDKWIQPQLIPQSSGAASNGYSIQVWNGDPNGAPGTYNEILTSDNQGAGEVSWVFNYDLGLLLISGDMPNWILSNRPNSNGNIDIYITGFRYIGTTLAGSSTSGTSGSSGSSGSSGTSGTSGVGFVWQGTWN